MKIETIDYNPCIQTGVVFMRRIKKDKSNGHAQENQEELFGKRMAKLRKAAGYTQKELAPELGISPRMVAYYEAQTKYPPVHLLPKLADLMGVTIDELMGKEPIKQNKKKMLPDNRLWKRVKQLEKLPVTERRHITKVIDTFLEIQKLKQSRS